MTRELIIKDRIDDHHVFPRAYLRSVGEGEAVDSVLNHCLIDHETNVVIGRRPPSEYLADIRRHLGQVLDEVLASHHLPSERGGPLDSNDFDAFLRWRRDRLAVLLIGLTGGRFGKHITDERSAIDAEIESIELALRKLVVVQVGSDEDALPSHVKQKARERFEAARRKYPAIADGGGLERLLEYCDLRELQDVLTNKTLWQRFEPALGTKEMVSLRLGQLADLRNSIRHSRTLDPVIRKDGEAAIMWFQGVLKRSLVPNETEVARSSGYRRGNSTGQSQGPDGLGIQERPTDAEIEQTLRDVDVVSWRKLTDAIDAVFAEDEHGTWAGGEQIGTVDESKRPVMHVPYPVYSGAVNALIEALYEVGAIVSFDWGSWIQLHAQRGAAAYENASTADAVRFLTASVRGERFGDGLILDALNDGTMIGALRTLRHWRTASS